MVKRVVLAFDGGVAAAAALARLARGEGTEVVTLTLDAGEGPALEAIRDRALAAGAVRAHVVDVRDEFAREYLLPALRAGVLAGAGAAPRPALRRALLSRKLAEIAALEGATTFEAAETDAVDGTGATTASPATSADPAGRKIAEGPAHLEIAFTGGAPEALNGVAMGLTELFGSVATIAGEHGIPLSDPVLQTAHRELTGAALSADVLEVGRQLRGRYAAALASGGWFTPLRAALDAFFATAQANATGAVRMKLFKGECAAVETTIAAELAQRAE